MAAAPSIVFIPGGWHKPSCYNKVIQILQSEQGIRCTSVTLPSTLDNPDATFKDDIDAARSAIVVETSKGRDVVVVVHSYGGMVGNSAIKDLTPPKAKAGDASSSARGYVKALVLIASGYTITGLAFMDPFFGHPPPAWRVNKETGYAELVANPREFFYHDVPDGEADYWVSQLTTQSLKSLFEGGEHAYAGWQDVPSFYIGTTEDRGLPVAAQRVNVGMARAQGGLIHHVEMESSHSPFLSMPKAVARVIVDAVEMVRSSESLNYAAKTEQQRPIGQGCNIAAVTLRSPGTWFKFGIPYLIGRTMGLGIFGYLAIRRLWKRA